MTDMRRLRFKCRRGMKELDELLLGYLERRYAAAPTAQRARFESMLELEDPALVELLLGSGEPEDGETAIVIRDIRQRPAR